MVSKQLLVSLLQHLDKSDCVEEKKLTRLEDLSLVSFFALVPPQF
jgi:hypothetical protein